MDWLALTAAVLRYGMLAVLVVFLLMLLNTVRLDLKRQEHLTAKRSEEHRIDTKGKLGLKIVISTGEKLAPGRVVPLAGEILVGRGEDNDLVVEDAFASHHHARIWVRGGICQVEDLGSTNGTLLNGTKIVRASPVNPGDLIKVGGAAFELVERSLDVGWENELLQGNQYRIGQKDK